HKNVDKFLDLASPLKVLMLAGTKKKAGIPPLYKALSTEFEGTKFGYVPSSEDLSAKLDGHKSAEGAQLLIFKDGSATPVLYDGELKKTAITQFLTSQQQQTQVHDAKDEL